MVSPVVAHPGIDGIYAVARICARQIMAALGRSDIIPSGICRCRSETRRDSKALPMRLQPEVDGPHGWYQSHAGSACVPKYQVKMNAGNPRSGKYLLCRKTRESGLKWPTVRTISTKVTGKGHNLLFLVRIVRPRSCRESPVCEDKHPWKERDTCCALPPRIPEAYWKPRS